MAVTRWRGVTELRVVGSVTSGQDSDGSGPYLLVRVLRAPACLPPAASPRTWRTCCTCRSTSSPTTASRLASAPASSVTRCRRESQRPGPAARPPEGLRCHRRALQCGPLSDSLVFDAVRARLIEIGEAVKDVSTHLLSQQPSSPWRQVAAMRNELAHRYFDTSHAIIAETVGSDLAELTAAVSSLLESLDTHG